MDKKDKTRQLTERQLKVVDLLISGVTQSEAARQTNIARQTINLWINKSPKFKAEMNLRRTEIWKGYKDKLRSMVSKSLDILDTELDINTTIENGDPVKAALSVLKIVSTDDLRPDFQCTDARLIAENEIRAEKRESDLASMSSIDKMGYEFDAAPILVSEKEIQERLALALDRG